MESELGSMAHSTHCHTMEEEGQAMADTAWIWLPTLVRSNYMHLKKMYIHLIYLIIKTFFIKRLRLLNYPLAKVKTILIIIIIALTHYGPWPWTEPTNKEREKELKKAWLTDQKIRSLFHFFSTQNLYAPLLSK